MYKVVIHLHVCHGSTINGRTTDTFRYRCVSLTIQNYNGHYVSGIIFPNGELLLIKFRMKQYSFIHTQSTHTYTYLTAAYLEKLLGIKIAKYFVFTCEKRVNVQA